MPKVGERNLLRIIADEVLKNFVAPFPEKWVNKKEIIKITKAPLPCEDWDELLGYWRLSLIHI